MGQSSDNDIAGTWKGKAFINSLIPATLESSAINDLMGNCISAGGSSSSSGAPAPPGAPAAHSSSLLSVPSTPIPVGYEYEVFLSFRGADTRTTFTDHLYHGLVSAGIRAFRDDEELRKGEEIGPELLTAIKQSKISIPILSKGYAESKWCLKEAAQMVDCMETTKQLILPVFYDVKPHQVRHQTEEYGLAFRTHEKNHSLEILTQWKDALSEIGKLKGWDVTSPTNGYQGKLVKEIVSEVWRQLNRSKLENQSHLIGIDDHVDEIMDMLDIERPEVRVVGIWGMGGVGKTTLAKFVYNQLADHFEHCCFLSNIREKSSLPDGMESLQRQLVSDIFMYKHEKFDNTEKGRVILKCRIPTEKVLILLDDVDHPEQLSNLLPDPHGYAPGSRIIVTTRNRDVLKEFKVTLIYEVTEMNQEDAMILFCKHAFRQNFPIAEYAYLSWEIVKATGGLPLAIEAIGSYLSSRLQEDVWREAVERLRKEKRIQERLKISYDALDHDEQQIFLDIACFFTGMDYRVLIHMWRACGFSPASAIQDLLMRSLIKIGGDNEVWMHDQLKDLGREIVRQENHYVPAERSRLWCHKDAIEVLEWEEGTSKVESKVEAIHLDHGLEEVEKHFEGQKFARLTMLRLLELGHANLGENFDRCLLRLKWLSWHGNTQLNVPSDLHPKDLIVLDLSNSSVTTNWTGWSSDQVLKKLEVVNLTGCQHLMESPHFTSFLPIKKLILEDCRALVMVHQSIGHLTTLESLSLKNCCRLRTLPEELGSLSSLVEIVVDGTLIQELPISAGMTSLKILSAQRCRSLTQIPDSREFLKLQKLLLNHCESLEEIPSSVGYWKSLEELNLSHTSVRLLPDSIGNLTNLKELDISHSSVGNFPRSLEKLQKLEVVNASYCQMLAGTIPFGLKSPTSLRIMRLDHTSVAQVPSSIQELGELKTLDLKSCTHLETLPDLPLSLVNLKVTCRSPEIAILNFRYLVNLKHLEISGCSLVTSIPENIGFLSRLKELLIEDCPKLQSLPQLPSGLRRLRLSGLSSLERLPDLSNLNSLSRFCLLNCAEFKEIPGLNKIVPLKTLRISSPLTNPIGLECLSSLSYLEVEGCKFQRISDVLVASLEILHISDCGAILELPDLSSLHKLKQLKLRCCHQLKHIPALTGLASLDILEISDCFRVKTLPDLSSLSKLKHLKLGCGTLEHIPGLMGLASLEMLEIHESKVKILPDLSSLHKLKHLKLRFCRLLQQIPALTGLASLEILEISGCFAMKTLPDLSSLHKLKQLKLYRPAVERIPELMGLASLEMLEIHESKVKILPDLSSLIRLKQLKLRGCHLLQEIPELTRLASLEILEILDCFRLEMLPDLSSLRKLKQLKLGWQTLQEIPELTGLISLEILEISDCFRLKMLPDLSSLRKLKQLKLGCQTLQEIPELTGLISLEILDIHESMEMRVLPDLSSLNKLKQLKLYRCNWIPALAGLASLQILDISECSGVEMLLDLSCLPKLDQLRLHKCGLRQIPALTELTSLKKLEIIECHELLELPNLSSLYNLHKCCIIYCNRLSKMQGLDDLVSLEVLHVSKCCEMKDLGNWSNLVKLRELNLCGLPSLVEIPGLLKLASLAMHDALSCQEKIEVPDEGQHIKGIQGELVALEVLYLSHCEAIYIFVHSKLKKLRELKLTKCLNLVGIRGLREFVSLEVLDLSRCYAITEIPDLSELQNLRVLILANCSSIVRIEGLKELVNLETLDLSTCDAIEKTPNLSKLQKLRELKLQDCSRLLEVEGLGELVSLEVLNLSVCRKIKKIPDLSKLQNLRELDLACCEKLVQIRGLGELVHLQVLDLSWCGAIEEIPDLSKLQRLVKLSLSEYHMQRLHGTPVIDPTFF